MAKSIDLTGQRFGKLVVIEKMPETQERYCLWRCRCDCGGEILVNTKRLKRGTITNCGCIPKTTAHRGQIREDLTGRRFGRLVVLHPAENRRDRTCWVCRCDCGNQITTTAHELKAGKTTSCGCLRGLASGNFRDITGRKVGRLTVLYPTEARDPKGSILWHCRCDCGNEVDVSEDGLIHGNYKSCGCLKSEIQQDVKNQLHRLDGTCLEWLEKRKHRSDNTSGFRGVYACHGKFRASIGFKKQRFHIGTYDTFEEAVQARLEAEGLIHDGFVKAYYAWQEQGGDGPFIYEVEKVDGWFKVHTNIERK